ncbi:MAG: hypothetical protein ACK5MY_17540 [Jhaorihella sp.]
MHKIFELITEIIGWLYIVASPFFIGLLIGSIVYFPNQNQSTLIIGICIAVLGLIIGILFATKIFKSKNGTIWFLSRTMATPELDEKQEND